MVSSQKARFYSSGMLCISFMVGHGRGVERRAVKGRFSKQSCDSASEVSHVACRPQAVFPPNTQILYKSCLGVREGTSTKGTRTKGHFCAYSRDNKIGNDQQASPRREGHVISTTYVSDNRTTTSYCVFETCSYLCFKGNYEM